MDTVEGKELGIPPEGEGVARVGFDVEVERCVGFERGKISKRAWILGAG
jgi:hypothetical protein